MPGTQLLTAAVNLDVQFPLFPDAACVDADPSDFFPPVGFGNAPSVALAKQVCAGCAERLRCLEWALERDEWGVWGGTTEKERRKLTGKRRR